MSKHQKIIDYKKEHPKATAIMVAEALGVAKSYVYTAYKNDRSKKLRVPKFQLPEMLPMPDVSIHSMLMRNQDNITNLEKEVKKLEHEAIGYRSVISYLEFQLGLKSTQNGTSV
jgi:hypothetical protein